MVTNVAWPSGGTSCREVTCPLQIFEVHNVARRVQDIVREYAVKALAILRPIDIARGMVAQPPFVLDVVHIGAHLGAGSGLQDSLSGVQGHMVAV
jgi:hypothetical protein